MKHIAIYGAGGFGRETEFLIRCINNRNSQFEFVGFIDDNPSLATTRATPETYTHLAIGIAIGKVREKIFKSSPKKLEYPNLVHPDVFVDKTNSLGKGLIVCAGVQMTVGIKIGDFVIVNLNSTIGHDVVIGDYCSIMPNVNVSGSVVIGRNVFIGSGATILQGRKIGDNAVIGAGAVVTRDVPAGMLAKGIPARLYENKTLLT